MKKSLHFLAAYILYWITYFLVFRIIFLLYHQTLTKELELLTIGGILWNGFKADLVFSAALCFFPALLLVISSLLPSTTNRQWLRPGLKAYTTTCLIFFTILCSSDLELFRIWGYRLDASPLLYLSTPTEMLFSVGSSPLWMLIILNALVNLYFGMLYARVIHPLSARIDHTRRYTLTASVFSLAAALLIMPIWEKPLDLSPKPHSNYFSDFLFANQATINIPWNFLYALRHSGSRGNPYRYLPSATADSLLSELYTNKQQSSQAILKEQPNVVLIIWESFTAKVSRHTGSMQGVTPRFDQLAEDGLLFTRFFASGDRSDKGLVSLLSAYPAQPTSTLLATPEKAANLPYLNQALSKAGYHTSFYYGGQLDFANLETYLQHAGYDRLVSAEAFRHKEPLAHWGAHDEVVVQQLWDDIRIAEKPFFKVMFTLSSHEPFDIPVPAHFKGKGSSMRFLSALHYSDSVIGNFIEQAKKEDWYANTLFIIVGDHGHTYPGSSRVYEKDKFHIPMLWTGGAVNTPPARINKTGSQTDLAASLLQQLSLPSGEYPWSRNILNPQEPGFAHYFFHDGVGLVTDSSSLSFDNIGRRPIEQQGRSSRAALQYARAYLQKSYGDYLNK